LACSFLFLWNFCGDLKCFKGMKWKLKWKVYMEHIIARIKTLANAKREEFTEMSQLHFEIRPSL